MPTKLRKGPRLKKIELDVDPRQGAAMLAASIRPPTGYVFLRMDRKNRKVVITFIREDLAQVQE